MIPIILIIAILVFYIESKILKSFIITFLILVNLGNHFTESTLKQFFSERPRLNPNFEKAFEIIEKSQNKKLNFYTNEINDKNENNINTVLSNYSKIMLNQKNYNIDILEDSTQNFKGKIWNICLNIISCDTPPVKSNILKEFVLRGGLKLSLWEIE